MAEFAVSRSYDWALNSRRKETARVGTSERAAANIGLSASSRRCRDGMGKRVAMRVAIGDGEAGHAYDAGPADGTDAPRRVLVAGIGNIFLGDDGFGVEVVARLSDMDLAPGVTVADYGIRGLHLAYAILAGGHDTTILVDAVPRGDAPGTVYLIEADTTDLDRSPVDAHGMHPVAVLGLLRQLGGEPGRVLVVGCEPERVDEGIGLSAPVAAAVEEAVRLVRTLTADLAGSGDDGDGAVAPTGTASEAAGAADTALADTVLSDAVLSDTVLADTVLADTVGPPGA
jgi:hydrogenase maturation protease